MSLTYDDVVAKYEPVLGLEVHVELNTSSKMFCGCSTTFGAEPNTQTCPVCLALPGALPTVNEKAIESTIKIGLALNCSIAPFSRFARKNYFYPDMPKNFQISQYDEPICVNGYVDVEIETDEGPKVFRVEVERVHMEEDTGKSLHVGGATGRIHGAGRHLLEFKKNRVGENRRALLRCLNGQWKGVSYSRGAKLDHDRVSVTIDDLAVILVAIGLRVLFKHDIFRHLYHVSSESCCR